MRRIVDYTIVDHGVDHAQYFQGEGPFFSMWDDVATGAGENAKEAYEQAVEQLAQDDWDVDKLPKRPRGISTKMKVRRADIEDGDSDESEIHYYVSIKVRGDDKPKTVREQVDRTRVEFKKRARLKNAERGNRPDVRVRHPAPRLNDVTVGIHEERGDLDIYVTDTRNDRTVAEWHDDEARDMIEDGFFQRGGRLRASVLDYCVEHGIVKP